MKLPYRFINRQLCIQIYEEPQTLGTLHPDIAPPCHPAPLTLAPLVLNLLASQHSFHCTHDSGPPWLPIPLKLYPNTTKTAPFWHPATLLLHTLLLLPCHLFKGHAERRRGLAWGFLALWWHHLPVQPEVDSQSFSLWDATHILCVFGERGRKWTFLGPLLNPSTTAITTVDELGIGQHLGWSCHPPAHYYPVNCGQGICCPVWSYYVTPYPHPLMRIQVESEVCPGSLVEMMASFWVKSKPKYGSNPRSFLITTYLLMWQTFIGGPTSKCIFNLFHFQGKHFYLIYNGPMYYSSLLWNYWTCLILFQTYIFYNGLKLRVENKTQKNVLPVLYKQKMICLMKWVKFPGVWTIWFL